MPIPLHPDLPPHGKSTSSDPIPLGLVLRVWFGVGMQSFGGGTATLTIVQRTVTTEQKWLTDIEFAHYWGLCQVAPGINLLALTLLIGRRKAGFVGALVSLFGLLFPSVAITILMTAGYASVRHAPQMQAALRGLLPATIGLGFLTSARTLHPLLFAGRKQGLGSLSVYLLLLIGSGAAVSIGHVAVVYVLIASGLLCAGFHWLRAQRAPPAAANSPDRSSKDENSA